MQAKYAEVRHENCDDRFCSSKRKSGKTSVEGIWATSACEQQVKGEN